MSALSRMNTVTAIKNVELFENTHKFIQLYKKHETGLAMHIMGTIDDNHILLDT